MLRKNLSMLLALMIAVGSIVLATPVSAQQSACQLAKTTIMTGITRTSIMSDGVERPFILFVPTGYTQTSDPVPLVFSLHGLGSNATEEMNYTRWNPVAEANTFIMVYPDGTNSPRQWNAYDGRTRLRKTSDADDVQFFRDLISYMQTNYCIDPARLYVNGISNGGAMTVRLACALNDQLAAVATVAAAVVRTQVCTPPAPIPLMEFHGTKDTFVPYDQPRGLFPPVKEWTHDWAVANGCDATPLTLPTQGEVSGEEYQHCTNNANVILYTIEGGGHTWPGTKAHLLVEQTLGYTTQDIDATATMWQFFVAHPRQ
ncbi:MAG: hypothetical protein KF716_07400 [Anaerolineae bacterium]|nr:hypothetical protein [Anaerolineae bacterium]